MTAYKHYFIVGTNDNALHDTMNGNVTGELIRCKDCKRWKRNDGTFPDFDGKEWHECDALYEYRNMHTSERPVTPAWFYCGYAERKETK